MNISDILTLVIFRLGDYQLHLGTFILAILVLIGAKVLFYVTNRLFLRRFFNTRKTDVGRQFAVKALVKYVIYTIAIIYSLQVLGLKPSILWGGAAALLVGIGLGLQQTFNDLFSGIILLTEATVAVGDVLMVKDVVGRVESIGIRTSKLRTRDDFTMIIPNSKLVTEKVQNWSHGDHPLRFEVEIAAPREVAPLQIEKLLTRCALGDKDVLLRPEPCVQLVDINEYSIRYRLLFFSYDYMAAEFTKSRIRKGIIVEFAKEGLKFPSLSQELFFNQLGANIQKDS